MRIVRALEATLAEACERGDFRVAEYSIQADHLHFLVEAQDRTALGRGMKSISARASRVGRVDPASSGRWFAGWREGVVVLARSQAPVARARSWLLRVGWQRHGLLDPSEVPGLRAP